MFISFVLEIIALVFFTFFGMSIAPNDINRNNSSTAILITPIFGLSAWLVICIFFGFFISYNRFFLSVLLTVCGIFIFYKRDKIIIKFDRNILLFVLLVVISSFYVLCCVLPREINGGLYFTPSAFDHQRTAIINSI